LPKKFSNEKYFMLKQKRLEGHECGPCEIINQKIIRIINKECQRDYQCLSKLQTMSMSIINYKKISKSSKGQQENKNDDKFFLIRQKIL
jgi:hypothetical protein